jgi:hypothetical protein
MQPTSSTRPATTPTIEQQASADRAEQHRVDLYARWHWGWVGIAIEVIGLARGWQARDIDEVSRHSRHLEAILVRLRAQEPAP